MIVDTNRAVTILKEGGILIFPTDTAFGIGCRLDNTESIEKLFRIRKRPLTMAPPVLFESIEMVKAYTKAIPSKVKDTLMQQYWPGALTIILPANVDKVPSLVRGGGMSIGTRIPDHEVALSLIRGVGVPIIGTSANFHGEPTPYEFKDLNPELLSLVDGVVEGVCKTKRESTVLDCTREPWSILREGAVQV